MKKFAILSVTFIFVALFSVLSFAQATSTDTKKESSLLASWEVTFSAPGQDVPGTLKLEKDGDNFKGIVNTAMTGDSTLKNIKVKDDNTFTADISVNVQGQTFDGTMTGKLDGETLSGELNLSGLGAVPYSGKKAEKK